MKKYTKEKILLYKNSKYPRAWVDVFGKWSDEADYLEARLASARAIMEKFVGKVDSGQARSKETYTEMKAWLEE